MKDTHALYMVGNGRMAAAFIGGELFEAYGPPYSSPSAFESVFLPAGAWHGDTPRHDPRAAIWTVRLTGDGAGATVTDFACADEACLVRRIEAPSGLKMRLRPYKDNAALFHYATTEKQPGLTRVLFKTRCGNAVYNDYPLPYPQFFTLLVRGDAAVGQCGTFSFDITVTGTAELLLVGGPDYPSCDTAAARLAAVPYEEMLAQTRQWWAEQMKPLPASDALPQGVPHREKIADALEDTALCLLVQQSAEGGVLAGHNFHLGYVRDQFGVCMAMLHLGFHERARRMLDFYIDVYRKNGKVLNAQALGVRGLFHFAENDSTEIPGYLLLQFFRYAQITGDMKLLLENADLLQWLYDRQASQLCDGTLPFNGDETYIAGGLLPRDAINDGSAEATMLFLLSGKCLLDFLRQNHLAKLGTLARMRSTLEQTEATYTSHFVRDGRYILNDPDRLNSAEQPEYRYGVCMNLGVGDCDFFGWTKKCGEVYLCPLCISRRADVRKKQQLYEIPSALLMPAYLDAYLLDRSLITGYLSELTERLARDGHVYSDEAARKNVGYDYGLLLYNLVRHDLPGADAVCEKLLSMRDEVGVWSEYYIESELTGTRYRPWESAINADALLMYAQKFA